MCGNTHIAIVLSGAEQMGTRRFVIRSGADVGRTLAEARTERHLTQRELADRAGIERSYVTRLENGDTVKQVERALDLLRELGVTLTATMDTTDA